MQRLAVLTFLGLLAIACAAELDDATDLASDEGQLTALPPPPPPPRPTSVANRLVWTDFGANGKLFILDGSNHVTAQVAFNQPGREVIGVAGDRILWKNGADAEMRRFDDQAVIDPTPIRVRSPEPGFFPVAIALASTGCWRRDDSQNYFVLWDSDVDSSNVSIQLIDGAGAQRRVNKVLKPLGRSDALWFGFAADGFEHLVLRSETAIRDAYDFRASWANATYTFTQPARHVWSRPLHKPMSAGMGSFNSLLVSGRFDQVLMVSDTYTTDGGRATLEIYDPTTLAPVLNRLTGQPLVHSLIGGNGYAAKAYAGTPPVCY